VVATLLATLVVFAAAVAMDRCRYYHHLYKEHHRQHQLLRY
jgi:spore maturation protein SpmA